MERIKAFLQLFRQALDGLKVLLDNFETDPEIDPRTLPMNLELPPTPPIQPAVTPKPEPQPFPGARLYNLAKASLGTDVSPNDLAADELGCAESVSALIHKAYGDFPDNILGTPDLFKALKAHPKFRVVPEGEERLQGDIIVCVTGQGNGKVPHGHCGINGKDWIMSNDSISGTFRANYKFDQWRTRYSQKGGYPIHIFRRI